MQPVPEQTTSVELAGALDAAANAPDADLGDLFLEPVMQDFTPLRTFLTNIGLKEVDQPAGERYSPRTYLCERWMHNLSLLTVDAPTYFNLCLFIARISLSLVASIGPSTPLRLYMIVPCNVE